MNCAYCYKTDTKLSQCSKCHRASYCTQNCQKLHWNTHKPVCNDANLIEWPPALVEEFLELFIEHLDVHKIIYLIDRSAAQKFKEKTHGGGCGHKHHSIELNENTTSLERLVAEVTSRSHLYMMIPSFIQQTSEIFEKIKSKGKQDGLVWDTETEKKVLEQVFDEAISRRLVAEVNAKYRKEEESFSKQPMLLAYPSGYKEETNTELNVLGIDTVQGLMENDMAYVDDFFDYDTAHGLFAEAETLDFDGRFEEIMQQKIKNIRTDKMLWIRKDIIDAAVGGKHESPLHLTLSYCKNLKKISDVYFSLPFELNKKTKLGLQLIDSMCLDCFSQGTFHKPHSDSGFGKDDTGCKITCIYVISNSSDNTIEINNTPISLVNNRLFILKSRKCTISIPPVSEKLFLCYYYILGPCDPYQ